jgi:hypothetical protein
MVSAITIQNHPMKTKKNTSAETTAGEQHICPLRSLKNNESLVVFEERPDDNRKKRQDAQQLFESFTASIIQERTIFFR